jgi:hypothetical protein
MRFVGAPDSVCVLAIITWSVFDHYVDTTWHISTKYRRKGDNLSYFEFVRAHIS